QAIAWSRLAVRQRLVRYSTASLWTAGRSNSWRCSMSRPALSAHLANRTRRSNATRCPNHPIIEPALRPQRSTAGDERATTRRRIPLQSAPRGAPVPIPSPRSVFVLTAVACAGLLGFGYYLEFHHGLEPCPMCIFQRLCFMAIVVL